MKIEAVTRRGRGEVNMFSKRCEISCNDFKDDPRGRTQRWGVDTTEGVSILVKTLFLSMLEPINLCAYIYVSVKEDKNKTPSHTRSEKEKKSEGWQMMILYDDDDAL